MRISRENWRRITLFMHLIVFAILTHIIFGLGQTSIPTGKNYIMTCLAWELTGLAIIIRAWPPPPDA